MADLGAIAMKGMETKGTKVGNAALQYSHLVWKGQETKGVTGALGARPAERFQSLTAGTQRYALGGEDVVQGQPAGPSLRMDSKGSWRFRWAFPPGAHTMQVNVLQAINQSPRPSMVIKANPAIGIGSDIETVSAASSGWTTIGPISITASAAGATWVELRCNLETNVGFSPCYWDHIVKT